MATIWLKQTENCRYEVRTAGNSVRLYSNGVFHSQWNAKKPVAGHLWDLLFFPICFYSDWSRLKSALVLGVGGGAVINLFQRFCSLQNIVAVDMDDHHFYVAEKFFGINQGESKVQCVCREAKAYAGQDTQQYQYVLEDLFIDENGTANAVRAIKADVQWLSILATRLVDDGILVMNFESVRQMRASLSAAAVKQAGFVSVAELSLPRYENAIAVLSKAELKREIFFRNMAMLESAGKFSFDKNEYHLRIRKL